MITIHHLHESRSLRVVWLMEELGLPYDLVCHKRQADMRAAAELKAVHPLGRAPVVVDGATVMFESGAILEYVIHRFGQGRLAVPCHHMAYADYLTWLHAAEGTAMPALIPVAMATLAGSTPDEAAVARNGAVLALCEAQLTGRDYFAGSEFSAADIMMHTYVSFAAKIGGAGFASHAELAGYLGRVETRPAYLRALEVAEPRPDASAVSA